MLRHVLLAATFLTLDSLSIRSAVAATYELGDVAARVDLSVTYGASFRMEQRDPAIVCIANGGAAFGCNADDGTLNYRRGLAGNAVKLTGEIEFDYGPVGGFMRAVAFRDFENYEGRRERTPLVGGARELIGSAVDVLDLYGTYDFGSGARGGQVRVGKQVLNWGESTFIGNGINVVNPVDVSKLRVPGARLQDALVPVPLISTSLGITPTLAAEAFYQVEWDEVTLEPVGSLFSTTDLVGAGGRRFTLGFGSVSDLGDVNPGLGSPGAGGRFDRDFLAVPRTADVNPSDGGQFGLALRVLLPRLNDTEMGLYFVRYHSRLPVVSTTTGSRAGAGNAIAAGVAGSCFAGVQAGCPVPVAGTAGNAAASISVGSGAGRAGGADAADASATRGVTAVTNTPAYGPEALSRAVTDLYARTAGYFASYPERINLFGLSFNSLLPNGIALQGEVSHRRNVPLQIDDVEILLATVTPIATLDPAALDNQITRGRALGPRELVRGFIRRDVTQIQITASKVLGPAFGSDELLLVGEVGWQHVHNMPAKSWLRLEGPGTFTSGNPAQALGPGVDPAKPLGGAHPGKGAEPISKFADADSWGYRIAGRLKFNNAIGSVNLMPNVSWIHDVEGNTPLPAGTFQQGRKAVSIGLTATYRQQWTADVTYTTFFGSGRYNLLQDRDFVEARLEYSF